MEYGFDERKCQGNVGDITMKTTKKTPKPYLNPFEQVVELGKDTLATTVKEVVNTVNPFAELFTNPTAKERAKGNNNFTELDFDKLNNQYSEQDNPDLEAIRTQLKTQYHKRVQREEEEENLKQEQEKQEEERQEALDDQQKAEAEAAANAVPLQAPKGKVRISILGGKGNVKASTELPPELKADAGRG